MGGRSRIIGVSRLAVGAKVGVERFAHEPRQPTLLLRGAHSSSRAQHPGKLVGALARSRILVHEAHGFEQEAAQRLADAAPLARFARRARLKAEFAGAPVYGAPHHFERVSPHSAELGAIELAFHDFEDGRSAPFRSDLELPGASFH